MIILVTGAYGFIGSNIVRHLNELGYTDIIAVDNLNSNGKMRNLVDCEVLDYVDKTKFLEALLNGDYDNYIDYIFHQGACSDTTNQDGRYMMDNNYEYSSILLEYAQKNEVPLLYASSAAVYGNDTRFVEQREYESPLNLYGYSKFLFDQMVRRYFSSGLSSPIVGLRYFNVYGKNEAHKKRMASVVLHNYLQYRTSGKVQLFEGCQGYGDGMQVRDFISVEDVVKVNMFFFRNHINETEEISGIFNCGTGISRSYNDLSLATINACLKLQNQEPITLVGAKEAGIIEYVPFPEDLRGRYQCYTQANIDELRVIGFKDDFMTLEEGVFNYVQWLTSNDAGK